MAPRPKPETDEVVEIAVDELVPARFVDVQAVFSPSQGVITYGDQFLVTPEQLEQDPRFIPWADDWTPDSAALAASTLEG